MRRFLVASVTVLTLGCVVAQPATAAQRPPDIDPVAVWNGLALDSVRATRASDTDAARSYAMVNGAVYDAVNGIAARHGHRHRASLFRPPGKPPAEGDQQAAAAAAAHAVLTRLYPDRSVGFDAQLAEDLAQLGSDPNVSAGRDWGQSVGAHVVAIRASDGSRPVETQPGGTGPGVFPLAWSGVQYRSMVPFGIADAGRYVAPGPAALTSGAYAAAFNDVRQAGDIRIPDAAKLAQFQYWSLAGGSVQPAGEWIKIGLEFAAARSLSLPDKARLAALLGVALSDASIPTTRTKFNFRHWRPETAIQQADTDGNASTEKDEGWKARAGSPGSTPEYVSGHSTFSAAAATVLGGYFCRDRIAFTHVSDTSPIDPATGRPMERSFTGFSDAAADAGRSRIFGGQHFEFSNQAGLTMGRRVAREVLATRLLYTTGPTHHGPCPL